MGKIKILGAEDNDKVLGKNGSTASETKVNSRLILGADANSAIKKKPGSEPLEDGSNLSSPTASASTSASPSNTDQSPLSKRASSHQFIDDYIDKNVETRSLIPSYAQRPAGESTAVRPSAQQQDARNTQIAAEENQLQKQRKDELKKKAKEDPEVLMSLVREKRDKAEKAINDMRSRREEAASQFNMKTTNVGGGFLPNLAAEKPGDWARVELSDADKKLKEAQADYKMFNEMVSPIAATLADKRVDKNDPNRAEKVGREFRRIMGDKTVAGEEQQERRGGLIRQQDKARNAETGLEAWAQSLSIRKAELEQAETPDQDALTEVNREIQAIQKKAAKLYDDYPEYYRQQLGRVVANEITKGKSNIGEVFNFKPSTETIRNIARRVGAEQGLNDQQINALASRMEQSDVPMSSSITQFFHGLGRSFIGASNLLRRVGMTVGGTDQSAIDYINKNATEEFDSDFEQAERQQMFAPSSVVGKGLRNVRNENAGKLNLSVASIASVAADTWGQILEAGLTGRAAGAALGKLSGRAASRLGVTSAERIDKIKDAVGLYTTTYMSTFDDNLRDAHTQSGGDMSKAVVYAALKSGVTAGTELVFPDTKIVDNIFSKLTPARFLKAVGEKGMGEVLTKDGLKSLIKNVAGDTIKEIGEEELDLIGEFALSKVIIPENIKDRNFWDEAKETAIQTGIGSVIPMTYSATRNRGAAYRDAIYEVGANPNTYLDQITAMEKDGTITPQVADSKKQVVETLTNLVKLANASGQVEKQAYVYDRLQKALLEKEKGAAQGDDELIQSLNAKAQADLKMVERTNQIIEANRVADEQQPKKKGGLNKKQKIAEAEQLLSSINRFGEFGGSPEAQPTTSVGQNLLNSYGLDVDSVSDDDTYTLFLPSEIGSLATFAGAQVTQMEDKKNVQVTMTGAQLKNLRNEELKSQQDATEKTGPLNQVKGSGNSEEHIGSQIREQQSTQSTTEGSQTDRSDSDSRSNAEKETLGQMIGNTVNYKGKRVNLFVDGQTVVAKVVGKNREYEIGNVDELRNTPIQDLGIQKDKYLTDAPIIDEGGNLNIGKQQYTFNPAKAVLRDGDGNVVSVSVQTKNGQKRTIKGSRAQEVADLIENYSPVAKSRARTFTPPPPVPVTINNGNIQIQDNATETQNNQQGQNQVRGAEVAELSAAAIREIIQSRPPFEGIDGVYNFTQEVNVPISQLDMSQAYRKGNPHSVSYQSELQKPSYRPALVFQTADGRNIVLDGRASLLAADDRGEKSYPVRFLRGTDEQARQLGELMRNGYSPTLMRAQVDQVLSREPENFREYVLQAMIQAMRDGQPIITQEAFEREVAVMRRLNPASALAGQKIKDYNYLLSGGVVGRGGFALDEFIEYFRSTYRNGEETRSMNDRDMMNEAIDIMTSFTTKEDIVNELNKIQGNASVRMEPRVYPIEVSDSEAVMINELGLDTVLNSILDAEDFDITEAERTHMENIARNNADGNGNLDVAGVYEAVFNSDDPLSKSLAEKITYYAATTEQQLANNADNDALVGDNQEQETYDYPSSWDTEDFSFSRQASAGVGRLSVAGAKRVAKALGRSFKGLKVTVDRVTFRKSLQDALRRSISPEKQFLVQQLQSATDRLEAARNAFNRKRKELDATMKADNADLFGNRASAAGSLLDTRVDPNARENAIKPFRDNLAKAEKDVARLTKQLAEAGNGTQGALFSKDRTRILGFVDANGTVHLNPDEVRTDTPIHEIGGHILTNWARTNNPALYQKIMSVGSDAPEEVKAFVRQYYPELEEDSDAFREEVFAHAVGWDESNIQRTERAAGSPKTITGKIAEGIRDIWNDFVNWLIDNGVIKFLSDRGFPLTKVGFDKVDFNKMSMADFTSMVGQVMYSGRRVSAESPTNNFNLKAMGADYSLLTDEELVYDAFGNVIDIRPDIKHAILAEKTAIRDAAIANGTFLRAPDGSMTTLTEDQWLTTQTMRFKMWDKGVRLEPMWDAIQEHKGEGLFAQVVRSLVGDERKKHQLLQMMLEQTDATEVEALRRSIGDKALEILLSYKNAQSKVFRKPSGDPQVYFHGTPLAGTEMDFNSFNTTDPDFPGAFFTTDPNYAGIYTQGNGQVKPVFLRADNPLDGDFNALFATEGRSVLNRSQGIAQGYDAVTGIDEQWNNAKSVLIYNPANIKSARSNTTFSDQTNDIRFQRIGEGANLTGHQRDGLAIANNMEEMGASPEQIHVATGWFRGVGDNKWRYELPNVDIRFKYPREAGRKRLGDILTYDALYSAYPDAANIEIDFVDQSVLDAVEGKGTVGAFYPDGSMAISMAVDPKEQYYFIRHEVQHWIQGKEGFEKGASYKAAADYLQSKVKDNANRIAEMQIQKAMLTGGKPQERSKVSFKVTDKSGNTFDAVMQKDGTGFSIKLSDPTGEFTKGNIKGDNLVASLNVIKTRMGYIAQGASVNKSAQRKGIATAMYNAIEQEYGITIVPSDDQTANAEAFWNDRMDRITVRQQQLDHLDKMIDVLKEEIEDISARPKYWIGKIYRNFAGEREAFDVERRAKTNEKFRANTFPDLGNPETVVTFNDNLANKPLYAGTWTAFTEEGEYKGDSSVQGYIQLRKAQAQIPGGDMFTRGLNMWSGMLEILRDQRSRGRSKEMVLASKEFLKVFNVSAYQLIDDDMKVMIETVWDMNEDQQNLLLEAVNRAKNSSAKDKRQAFKKALDKVKVPLVEAQPERQEKSAPVASERPETRASKSILLSAITQGKTDEEIIDEMSSITPMDDQAKSRLRTELARERQEYETFEAQVRDELIRAMTSEDSRGKVKQMYKNFLKSKYADTPAFQRLSNEAATYTPTSREGLQEKANDIMELGLEAALQRLHIEAAGNSSFVPILSATIMNELKKKGDHQAISDVLEIMHEYSHEAGLNLNMVGAFYQMLGMSTAEGKINFFLRVKNRMNRDLATKLRNNIQNDKAFNEVRDVQAKVFEDLKQKSSDAEFVGKIEKLIKNLKNC